MNLLCHMVVKNFLEKMIKIGLTMISMDDLMILRRKIVPEILEIRKIDLFIYLFI